MAAAREDRPKSENLRFRGLTEETRVFLESLEQEPCPNASPGGERVAYAAYVLSPLKALLSDLRSLLADVTPRLGIEAKVGASLYWTNRTESEDCPVRQIRLWDARRSPDSSPVLYATFSGTHIEIGCAARTTEAAELGRAADDSLLSPLFTTGWDVRDGEDFVVARRLEWEPWIDEAGLSHEIADRFRELLPLYDRMRAASHEAGDPGATPAVGAGSRRR